MQGDYDARIEDLRPDDRVRVECGCGRIEECPIDYIDVPGCLSG
jgi:hypothetical protein